MLSICPIAVVVRFPRRMATQRAEPSRSLLESLMVRDRIPNREERRWKLSGAIVEYFRDLECALNEKKGKGTPKGDSAYSRIYTQLAKGIFQIGIARDELPEAAKICGHLSTFERLEQLMKKPIG